MGLDQGDTMVRRRLAQKLTFLVEDTTRMVEPTEEELRQFHATNAATFAVPATVTFTQVFFNATDRADAASDANAALVKLTAEGNSNPGAPLGDRLLIEGDLRDADEPTVSGMFGPDFAREVFALKRGVWSGPIKSGYGVHLILLTDASAARPRPFEEVRDEVLQEWRRQEEEAAQRDYIDRLREKYGVILDDSVAGLLGSQSAKDVAVK
jgi:parvulin-like peptidyl-prolyl isomerase